VKTTTGRFDIGLYIMAALLVSGAAVIAFVVRTNPDASSEHAGDRSSGTDARPSPEREGSAQRRCGSFK
jgi:hypothetical protein